MHIFTFGKLFTFQDISIRSYVLSTSLNEPLRLAERAPKVGFSWNNNPEQHGFVVRSRSFVFLRHAHKKIIA